MEWTSPDDKIYKKVLHPSPFGLKPFENSEVKLKFTDCPPDLELFNDTPLIIGENSGDVGRLLDICICTMGLNECATFTLNLGLEQICAVIELVDLKFNGYIYEWDAKKRYDLAERHNNHGSKYFSEKNHYEAAHKFTKALKLINSIPISVEPVPKTVDGVKVADINDFKEKLYNNLASCYFRVKLYDLVIPLCQKALAFNSNNVKALYKMGVAYAGERDFEKAQRALRKAITLEPLNKACAEHLGIVEEKLKEANGRSNDLMKKMMQMSLSK
ncbi:tetratricopeptide repeat protein 9C-like [Euwallacea fornicatus]|uniref:tetratricopeptide repeat protein 9C-like n=1 Tax=Euwallacea fornicatus TaxID=995702 RepID=UPI00338FAE88